MNLPNLILNRRQSIFPKAKELLGHRRPNSHTNSHTERNHEDSHLRSDPRPGDIKRSADDGARTRQTPQRSEGTTRWLFLIPLIILLIVSLPSAIAANDPGHDTLYIESLGDSLLTGNLNISDEFRVSNLYYSANLWILGNGTIFNSPSKPSVQAASNQLYLDANGNLYVNTKTGTTGIVQVGPVTANGITLNVSGIIYEQGERVCLANGTNCVGGNNTGNISRVAAGNGISVANPEGPIATVSANANTCSAGQYSYWDGDSWECRGDVGSGGVAGGGWQNTSTLVHLVNNGTNVSIGNTTGNQPVFFVDTENGRVGIGTDSPTSQVYINKTNLADTYMDFVLDTWNNHDGVRIIFREGATSTDIVTMSTGTGNGNIDLYFDGSDIFFRTNSGTETMLHIDDCGNCNNKAWVDGALVVDLVANYDDVSVATFTHKATPVTDYLQFRSDSATRGDIFAINASGNVGINDSTPTNTLDITGNIGIAGTEVISYSRVGSFATGTTVNSQLLCLADGTNCPGGLTSDYGGGWKNTTGAGNVSLVNPTANVSANTLFVDNTNARVGIGDTDPDAHLEVSASATTGGNILLLSSDDDNNGDILLVQEAGNIGINTTTPQNTLEVLGTINATAIQVGTTNVCQSDGTNCPAGASDQNLWETISSDSGSVAANIATDTLTIAGGASLDSSVSGDTVTIDVTDDSIDGTELADTITLDATTDIEGTASTDFSINNTNLYVDFSANQVGIGDITPSYTLDVNGQLQVQSITNPGIIIGDGSTGYLQIGNSVISDAASDLTLNSDTAQTIISDDLRIAGNDIQDSSGANRVSLGTTNTLTGNLTVAGNTTINAKLKVNGTANFTNGNVSIENTFSLCFNTDCTSRIYDNGTALVIEGQ